MKQHLYVPVLALRCPAPRCFSEDYVSDVMTRLWVFSDVSEERNPFIFGFKQVQEDCWFAFRLIDFVQNGALNVAMDSV
jgi:hypothetical protein